jgi:hypothetical protein
MRLFAAKNVFVMDYEINRNQCDGIQTKKNEPLNQTRSQFMDFDNAFIGMLPMARLTVCPPHRPSCAPGLDKARGAARAPIAFPREKPSEIVVQQPNQ